MKLKDWDEMSHDDAMEALEDAIVAYLLLADREVFSSSELADATGVPLRLVEWGVMPLMQHARLLARYEISCPRCRRTVAMAKDAPPSTSSDYHCDDCDLTLRPAWDETRSGTGHMNMRILYARLGDWARAEDRVRDQRVTELLAERQQRLTSDLRRLSF